MLTVPCTLFDIVPCTFTPYPFPKKKIVYQKNTFQKYLLATYT